MSRPSLSMMSRWNFDLLARRLLEPVEATDDHLDALVEIAGEAQGGHDVLFQHADPFHEWQLVGQLVVHGKVDVVDGRLDVLGNDLAERLRGITGVDGDLHAMHVGAEVLQPPSVDDDHPQEPKGGEDRCGAEKSIGQIGRDHSEIFSPPT
jgi:hypothetical protein